MNHTLGVLYKKSPPQVTKIVSYAFVGLGFYVKTYDPFELECTVTYGLNVLHVGTQLFSTVSGTNFPSLPFCLLCCHREQLSMRTGSALALAPIGLFTYSDVMLSECAA